MQKARADCSIDSEAGLFAQTGEVSGVGKDSPTVPASRYAERTSHDRDAGTGPKHQSMAFEELNFPLMLKSRFARAERAEIAALARTGIDFARIKSVLARFQLANHGRSPFVALWCLGSLWDFSRSISMAL
jgi:hypothetical protein